MTAHALQTSVLNVGTFVATIVMLITMRNIVSAAQENLKKHASYYDLMLGT